MRAASTICLVELMIPCARFVGSVTTHCACAARAVRSSPRQSRMMRGFMVRSFFEGGSMSQFAGHSFGGLHHRGVLPAKGGAARLPLRLCDAEVEFV